LLRLIREFTTSETYRSFVVASQSITWLVGQLTKLRFAVEKHQPSGLFEHGRERCLILAPTHQSLLDPWLIVSAMRYRQWRALIPLRTLATQTFHGPLWWLKPLIRILYRLEGAIELPPKEEEGDTLPEKLQGLLDALREGDVVMIFPEGDIGKGTASSIGNFAPGVVYLQRKSGAAIVPIAIWMGERRWPRCRYVLEIGRPVRIPESLELEAGASWLRERTVELYQRAKHEEMNVS
jgi:1-acyl-sn-glycerol-3-phosphate acyltransferase